MKKPQAVKKALTSSIIFKRLVMGSIDEAGWKEKGDFLVKVNSADSF